MASRRRTRGGGGSTESTGACSPTNMVNESMDVNANDLLAMLAGEEEETDEEEEEEEEGRDIVTALEGQFAGAIDQRKSERKRKRESEGTLSVMASASAPAAAPAAAPGPASRRLMKTITRIRKLGPDAGALSLKVDEGSSTTVTTTNPDSKTSRLARESFVSDRVLDESVGQEGVFCEIEPAVTGLFQGSSSIVLTYGATGSGKSYTIMGAGDDAVMGPGVEERQGPVLASGDGILPRALERMFRQVGRESSTQSGLDGGGGESSGAAMISVRAVEIYNNRLFDLLREGVQPGRHLSIRRGDDGQDVIQGLSVDFPADLPSALECAKSARSRAQVNQTSLNDKSSRGHVIFMLGVHGSACNAATDLRPSDPVMYICDLAGPERQNRAALAEDASGSGSGDAELRKVEATHINTDTTALFRAWKLVRGGSRFVSYRARTLTRVLKGLFVRQKGAPGMNCVMMVCLNPAETEYKETNKVLKNSQISSSVLAAVVEEGPSMRKRQRTRNRAAEGGGGSSACQAMSASADGNGKGKGRLNGAGGVTRGSGPERGGEQRLVVELREEIKQLLDEKVRMQEEHADQLYEVEQRAVKESEQEQEEMEDELREKARKIRQLTEQLESKSSPLGAGARAAAAHSEMKLRTKRAESVRKLERATTREADEEAARQADERARVEEKLAATLAERNELKALAQSEARRADAAEARTARALEERSEERSARRKLEGEVERLEAAAAIEAGRAGDLEGKLRAAEGEIARLESDQQAALSAVSAASAAAISGDSSPNFSPIMNGGSSEKGEKGSGGRRDGGAEASSFEDDGSGQDEEEQEASTVSMLDDFGRGISSNSSDRESIASTGNSSGCNVGGAGSLAGWQHQEAAPVGAPSPLLSGSTSDDVGDSDRRGEQALEEAEPRAVENPEPSPASRSPRVRTRTRGRQRLGQLEATSRIETSPAGEASCKRKPRHRAGRKPLGNLQNGATPARSKGAKDGGKKKAGVGENQEKAAAAVVVEVEEEENEQRETTTSGARGHQKRTRAEKARAKKAEEGNETRRCKEMRKNARLSKPSPDVVVMTEKQAKNVDIARRIVKERRRRR